MFLLRSFATSASMRAFSSAVYARPGDGGRASFIAFSRRNFVRIRSPWSPQSSMPRKDSVTEWEGKARKNAPKNGGGPEGTPPERLRYGAATKNQRVTGRFQER